MQPATIRANDSASGAAPGERGATAGADRAAGGLTAAQVEAISQARRNGRKITRAAGVAAVSGWTMAVFSFITLLTGLLSVVSLLLGLGLGVVAYFELRGSRRLRGLDVAAPIQLGFNQIALGVLIVLYCTWGIVQALVGPGPYDSYIAAGGDTARMIEPIDQLTRAITSGFYAVLLCVSVVAQSCTALYYFTRRRHMVTYLQQTPGWVVEMLRQLR